MSSPIPLITITHDNPIAAVPAVRDVLSSYGAVLVRGYNFDLRSFEEFSLHFCHQFHIPATRAARKQAEGDHYSTEVYRDNYSLLGHTEGTYKPYPRWPDTCFFMCITPPSQPGGETTVIDGVEFYKRLPSLLLKRLQKGVTYEMYWDRQRWRDEFEIEEKDRLEALLKTLPAVRYTFHDDDVHLYFTTGAITRTRAGDKVFANAMLAHLPRITHPAYADKKVYCKPSNKVYFADGQEIPYKIINQLIDIHDSIAYPHRWQRHDLLVLDNTRHMHGRLMTKEDCLRVLVSRFGWRD